jgi:hypothetical protein
VLSLILVSRVFVKYRLELLGLFSNYYLGSVFFLISSTYGVGSIVNFGASASSVCVPKFLFANFYFLMLF